MASRNVNKLASSLTQEKVWVNFSDYRIGRVLTAAQIESLILVDVRNTVADMYIGYSALKKSHQSEIVMAKGVICQCFTTTDTETHT